MGRWSPTPLDERFWGKVDKTSSDKCWLWKGSCFRQGYGAFAVTTKIIVKAHRMAYEFTHGLIPQGLILRHTCDNPPCVNPAHLIVGTTQDNMDDRQMRGRTVMGEASAKAKLKEEDVVAIIELRKNGVSRNILAEQFGVTKSTITNIHHGRAWKHVSERYQ